MDADINWEGALHGLAHQKQHTHFLFESSSPNRNSVDDEDSHVFFTNTNYECHVFRNLVVIWLAYMRYTAGVVSSR